jgi:hypothetical protein
MTHEESLAFVENLEKLGAKNIKAPGFSEKKVKKDGPPLPFISLILLELPTDPAARKQIFDIRAALEKKLNLEPEMVLVEVGGPDEENNKQEPLKDWGQKLLDIRLEGFGPAARGTGGAATGGDDEGDDDEEMEEDAPAPEAKPVPAEDGAPAETPAAEAPEGAAAPAPAGEKPAEPAPVDTPF